VRDVGEEGAERHEQPRVELAHDRQERLDERPPPIVRLDPDEHDDVAVVHVCGEELARGPL